MRLRGEKNTNFYVTRLCRRIFIGFFLSFVLLFSLITFYSHDTQICLKYVKYVKQTYDKRNKNCEFFQFTNVQREQNRKLFIKFVLSKANRKFSVFFCSKKATHTTMFVLVECVCVPIIGINAIHFAAFDETDRKWNGDKNEVKRRKKNVIIFVCFDRS